MWTTIGSCSYHRLFLPSEVELDELDKQAERAGPGAVGEEEAERANTTEPLVAGKLRRTQKLSFKFAPDLGMLVNPHPSSIVRFPLCPCHFEAVYVLYFDIIQVEGTDIWCIHRDAVSVTPLRASFTHASPPPNLKL
jgi:hypothetical protein